jgi:hypothetical protein
MVEVGLSSRLLRNVSIKWQRTSFKDRGCLLGEHRHVRVSIGSDGSREEDKFAYHGHRLPASIINLAVRWHYSFQLRLHDIEDPLYERGVVVSHESIRR